MFANFMIGLREGLEAALIIGILVAYLKKTDRLQHVNKIVYGVVAAILTATITGLALSALDESASEQLEITITGITSLLAVVFVTWMVFWMAKTARHLSKELQTKVDQALETSGLTLFVISYLTVVREGVETSIFLWTAAKTTGEGHYAWVGAFAGLALAAVLGYWIYKGMLKINLGRFFKYTGTYLLLLTAGILEYAIGEFTEIHWIPETATAFDLSFITPEGSPQLAFLEATIAYNPAPSLIQAIAWFGFLIVTVFLYLRQYRLPWAGKK
jgi:high-affinity iron transporter